MNPRMFLLYYKCKDYECTKIMITKSHEEQHTFNGTNVKHQTTMSKNLFTYVYIYTHWHIYIHPRTHIFNSPIFVPNHTKSFTNNEITINDMSPQSLSLGSFSSLISSSLHLSAISLPLSFISYIFYFVFF